jgi:hypothetical protein
MTSAINNQNNENENNNNNNYNNTNITQIMSEPLNNYDTIDFNNDYMQTIPDNQEVYLPVVSDIITLPQLLDNLQHIQEILFENSEIIPEGLYLQLMNASIGR